MRRLFGIKMRVLFATVVLVATSVEYYLLNLVLIKFVIVNFGRPIYDIIYVHIITHN